MVELIDPLILIHFGSIGILFTLFGKRIPLSFSKSLEELRRQLLLHIALNIWVINIMITTAWIGVEIVINNPNSNIAKIYGIAMLIVTLIATLMSIWDTICAKRIYKLQVVMIEAQRLLHHQLDELDVMLELQEHINIDGIVQGDVE